MTSCWIFSASVTAIFACTVLVFMPSYNQKPDILLGVCILSARDHFEQRGAIRNTWMGLAKKENISLDKVVIKFVVGEHACPIPPNYRTDEFGCQEWITNASIDATGEFEAFSDDNKMFGNIPDVNLHSTKEMTDTSFTWPTAESIGVIVLHSIIVHRIGIHSGITLTDKTLVVSVFKDAQEEETTLVEFSRAKPGVLHKGYRYLPITPLPLTAGTQVELSITSDTESYYLRTTENNNGETDDEKGSRADIFLAGTVSSHFVHLLSSAEDDSDTVTHNIQQQPGPGVVAISGLQEDGTVTKSTVNNSLFSLLSFMYTVENVEELKLLNANKAQAWTTWTDNIKKEQVELKREGAKYGDILFVDTKDVYRFLPSKLLQCNRWLAENYAASHMLKTDDDTFVALDRIIGILSSRRLQAYEWWGNFRKEWAVQRAGKWQEEDYSPSVYPPFACGSGYVISRDLHLWLANNFNHLHSFQGEDVSMAIWLAPLNPRLIIDRRFKCFKLCENDMLSIPDLTTKEILEMWFKKTNCFFPCSSC